MCLVRCKISLKGVCKAVCQVLTIDATSNLVFWSRLVNKLEPWHNVYIIQQKQNTLILTGLTGSNFLA